MLQAIWSSEMASGVPAIDELHHDCFEALTELSSVTNWRFSTGYATLVAKMERAFATEERWMEEIDFAQMKTHREQHARVLSALHHVHARIMDGDVILGREVVEKLLPQWFMGHMSTMDRTLALAIQMAHYPTVHRRSPSAMSYIE